MGTGINQEKKRVCELINFYPVFFILVVLEKKMENVYSGKYINYTEVDIVCHKQDEYFLRQTQYCFFNNP